MRSDPTAVYTWTRTRLPDTTNSSTAERMATQNSAADMVLTTEAVVSNASSGLLVFGAVASTQGGLYTCTADTVMYTAVHMYCIISTY